MDVIYGRSLTKLPNNVWAIPNHISLLSNSTTLASDVGVGPTFINFGFCFDVALRPYYRVHKVYLDGYLLHRSCVYKALHLFFLQIFQALSLFPALRLFWRLE